MSVPVWKRTLSKCEYAYQTYLLTQRLTQILCNIPKKYRDSYKDVIWKLSLEALELCIMSDSIYMRNNENLESDYKTRRECQLKARGKIQSVSIMCEVLLESIRHSGMPGIDSKKIFKRELEIGLMCKRCNDLIDGILKSDTERYRKYIKLNTA